LVGVRQPAREMNLKDKIAIVTGASSGLGRHFALLLAGQGAHVLACARRAEALAALADEIAAAGGRCDPLVMDVTDRTSVESAMAEAVRIAGQAPDILVNNAGAAHTKAAIDLTEEDWHAVLDPNLTGAFYVAQQAARLMRDGGGGSIVNIASILGERVAQGLAPYIASKAGLIHLTKALALEWARYNIRVNALAPGYVETDLNRDFFATPAGQRIIERIPQRRLGQLTDLDGPLLLLCSDVGAYMTGSVMAVDGGHLVNSL